MYVFSIYLCIWLCLRDKAHCVNMSSSESLKLILKRIYLWIWLVILHWRHLFQEEIREVFDGSCRLIPIKLIADECVDIANDFIPELIDTLASQMNPQLVCATAGLCNSARVDKLISENQVCEVKVYKCLNILLELCIFCVYCY